MANRCDICGKESQFGKNVSHSHRKSNKQFKANIQKVKAKINGELKTVKVCTGCLRADKIVKA
ncbi:MAG: 50S ribosomal protein L28 [Actinobacteria bacterium]|nr:MAG: 50S ribosomal protein L28 [Actinomycetota bacterium]